MAVTAPAFAAFVDDDGVFALDDKGTFKREIQQFKGCEVTVTVKRKEHRRSLDQNRYWWAEPVKRLADHCGYTDAQMHYALLGECFGYTTGPTGQPVPVKPSSSDLTVAEFTQLIEWVLTWAPAELQVEIMPPQTWQERHAA